MSYKRLDASTFMVFLFAYDGGREVAMIAWSARVQTDMGYAGSTCRKHHICTFVNAICFTSGWLVVLTYYLAL